MFFCLRFIDDMNKKLELKAIHRRMAFLNLTRIIEKDKIFVKTSILLEEM